MPLDSFATTSAVTAVQNQIAGLQSQITALSPLVIVSDNQPTTVEETLLWHKTNNGVYDGAYKFNGTGWFTPMPYAIGTILLVRNYSTLLIGFVPATDVSLPVIAGFTWYEFTAVGLLVVGNLAYKQSTQNWTQ